MIILPIIVQPYTVHDQETMSLVDSLAQYKGTNVKYKQFHTLLYILLGVKTCLQGTVLIQHAL